MKPILVIAIFLFSWTAQVHAEATPTEKKFYRDLILRIRTEAGFKVPMPANGDMHFDYKMEFDQPMWNEPMTNDLSIGSTQGKKKFFRNFWDKIFLKEGSFITVGGEQIPLTCVYVAGQDNRFSGKVSPLFPELILQITFVANDWTCQGPISPGWPSNGGKKEAWETYIHYEVKDPTIMLPTEASLRYRWSEFEAVLVR